jgi:hypothetical protein
MPTVITDKTDANSIEKLLLNFQEEQQVNILSSQLGDLERSIVVHGLAIDKVTVDFGQKKVVVLLNTGTVLENAFSSFKGLTEANEKDAKNVENVGTGLLWKAIPEADTSLTTLLRAELALKYKLIA